MAAKKQVRATQSFAEMTSSTVLKGLEPAIKAEISKVMPELYRALSVQLMQERAMMLTRQLAYERLVERNCPWFSKEILANEVADVEDESANLVATASPVQAGDKVRLALQALASGSTEWSRVSNLAIQSVGTQGPNGDFQTEAELENQLLGMTTGQTKEFPIGEDGTTFRVTVAKVSRSQEKASE